MTAYATRAELRELAEIVASETRWMNTEERCRRFIERLNAGNVAPAAPRPRAVTAEEYLALQSVLPFSGEQVWKDVLTALNLTPPKD